MRIHGGRLATRVAVFTGSTLLFAAPLMAQICTNCDPDEGSCELTVNVPGFGKCENVEDGCTTTRPGECLETEAALAPDGTILGSVMMLLPTKSEVGSFASLASADVGQRGTDRVFERDCHGYIISRTYRPEVVEAFRHETALITL